MRAALDDATVIHDDDPVGVHDARDTLCYDDLCAREIQIS